MPMTDCPETRYFSSIIYVLIISGETNTLQECFLFIVHKNENKNFQFKTYKKQNSY